VAQKAAARKAVRDTGSNDDETVTRPLRGGDRDSLPDPNRLAFAVRAVLPAGSPPECIPMAIVLAHHPMVS
jgi:hypothetical protein